VNRTQKVALAVLVLLAVLVGWLATRTRKPPWIPPDADHVGVALSECASCHGPDGVYFRGRNHPLGSDCTRCHAVRR